jgi:glycosyltransferase involved in cell wall biosynthesis
VSRLAFFSPVPPAATGIADYAADVLALLATRHDVEVFVDQPIVDDGRLGNVPAFSFEQFDERRSRHPFDLAVHQLGNSTDHAFVYDALARARGLLVLHDLVLHHARAKAFIDSAEVAAYRADPSSVVGRASAQAAIDGYRAVVAAEYPEQSPLLADVHLETVGCLLPYAYPLFRKPVEAATVVAGHNTALLAAVKEQVAHARVARIAMPMNGVTVADGAADELRVRLGIGGGEIVVGTFGLLTSEKEVAVLARAVGRAIRFGAPVRLLLVGPIPDDAALAAWLRDGVVEAATIATGRVALEDLPTYIQATDIAVHLRYPTARETSAALLRVLAQGRATVVSDLANFAEIPDDAVVKVHVTDEEGEVTRAILHLAESSKLRERLGRAAASYVVSEHSPARCLADYDAAIALAIRHAS